MKSLRKVKNRSIKKPVVDDNAFKREFVKDNSEDRSALTMRPVEALRYVKNPSQDLCLAAVRQNPDALQYVQADLLEDVKYALEHGELSEKESSCNYQQLFTEETSRRGFSSSTDIEAFRDELADSYFGDSSVTDPWEKAYKVLKGDN